MTTADQPTPDSLQPTDPARLGADQSPETSRHDDARDMSPVIAEADKDQDPATTGQPMEQPLGSEFDQQRRQSTTGTGEVSQGQGHAANNGDEDRGYDPSGYRGGLGSSGGREDLADHQPNTDANPYTGGYDGGGSDQPSTEQTKNLGLNTPAPAK